MKQTQTRVVSGGRRGSIVLAGERKGSSSHSGEWRESGVLSGAMARAVSCTLAVPTQVPTPSPWLSAGSPGSRSLAARDSLILSCWIDLDIWDLPRPSAVIC